MQFFGSMSAATWRLRRVAVLPGAIFLVMVIALSSTGCVNFEGDSEELSFKSVDGVALRATLHTPPNDDDPKLPGIILLHGAEKATRNRLVYKLTANVFLDRGFAVLVYDKRGAGESEGDHDASTYAQLVEDAIAAVALLRQHPRIDVGRIGILGISESGWLTPEIAERSGDIAFVINKVGSPLSVRDTIAWEVYNEMLDEGVQEDSAREQTDVYRRIWEYRVSPTASEHAAIDSVLAEWSERADSQLPPALKKVNDSYLADIRYDPTPYLERLEIPMLYLYGRHDVNIPTTASVGRLSELADLGKPFTTYVFEDEGHELGGFALMPPFYAFADNYAKLIGDFAEQHASD